MKSRIICAALFGILVYACAPKVSVSATKPDPVQVPPKIASLEEEKPISNDLAAGKSLYENNCAKCHDLYTPTDFTKQQWGPIIKRMQPKARIDDATTASIHNYIVSNLN